MAGVFFLFAGASLLLSLCIGLLMLKGSLRLGLVSFPGGRHIHASPMPTGGGFGIFWGAWIPILAGAALCWYFVTRHGTTGFGSDADDHAQGVVQRLPQLGIIFVGGLIVWVQGFIDDRWGISPWIRLGVEALVSLLLVSCGLTISIFIENPAVRAILTILWVTGLMNAFNMLDNMDGLSGGVGLIIGLFFTIVAIETGHYFVGAFLCCLIGAITGFLVLNFPPARIFMGDSGSTTIGYMLAAMTLQFTFFQPDTPYFPIVMPLMMFSLPLFDMITVVWIRVKARKNPLKGDTNHFSHRLVALGMSKRQAVLTIYLITATVALGATVLYYATPFAILVIFAQTIAIFAIIGILESARPNQKQSR